MKSIALSRFVLLFVLLLSPRIFAADKAVKKETVKKDAYAEAVASYIEGATQQLKAIREAVDTLAESATDNVKVQYAEVSRQLGVCDNYVLRLKAASPADFDRLKTEFERTRGEMVKTLDAIQKKN